MTEISKDDIINDMRNTKKSLSCDYLSSKIYDKNGKYSLYWAKKIFGSWGEAFKEAFGDGLVLFTGLLGETRVSIYCRFCGKETKNEKYCSRECYKRYNKARYEYYKENV